MVKTSAMRFFTIRDLCKTTCCRDPVGKTDGNPLRVFCRRDAGSAFVEVLIQFAVLIFAFAPFLARAGGDEVVVIYNSRLPESKAVADHYALLRQVPENQVFGFALPTNEEMSRLEFEDHPAKAPRQKAGGGQTLAIWHDHHRRDQRPARARGAPRGRIQNPLRRPVLRRAVENRRRRGFARSTSTPTCRRNSSATRRRWIPNSPGCRWLK